MKCTRKNGNSDGSSCQNGTPFIGINDSGGARIQEGVLSLDGYGHIFYRNAIYSGAIPQISVIMGPCAGGAVYSPAITDFILMVDKTSQMFITGPKVIETVTGEKISAEDLGGSKVNNAVSGNAHFRAPSEEAAIDEIKKLLSYLPQNNKEKAPRQARPEGDDYRPEIVDTVPIETTRPYDVRKVVEQVVDEGSFMEVHAEFAKT